MVAFYLIVGLGLRYPLNEAKIPVTGDEHHYLTQAISLIDDGDLVVLDNYENGDYLDVYKFELDASLWNIFDANGYSAHSPGVGVAIVPGWWLAGWFGVLVTLAVVMGATFLLTALALTRTLAGHLSTPMILILTSGFVALPLFPYSHTLYPEPFMALLLAGTIWLSVLHRQTPSPRNRTLAALGAISVAALGIGLHPKYFLLLLFVTLYFVVLDVYEAIRSNGRAHWWTAITYFVVSALWLTIFSWTHSLMWDTFHPAGWWFKYARASVGVSPGTATIHLLDLLFGSQNGLFFMVPLTLLAVAFLARTVHREPGRVVSSLRVLVVLALVSIVGLAAFSADWHGGDSPLGRYATPIIPLLLLVSVYVAANQTGTGRPLVFLLVLVGLGAFHTLAYVASPLSFRPRSDGAGGLMTVISERMSDITLDLSWFWSAAAEFSWQGIVPWIALLGMSLWLFGRDRDSREVTDAEHSPQRVDAAE